MKDIKTDKPIDLAKKDYRYYCALCWQEFDDPVWHKDMKLMDGSKLECRGDIREQVHGVNHRPRREKPPVLDFPGDPLIIK